MGKLKRIRWVNPFSCIQPCFLHQSSLRVGHHSGILGCQTLENILSISGHYRVPQKQKRKKKKAFSNGTIQFVQNFAVQV